MAVTLPKFTLEDGLDLNQLRTSGSILHINEHYDDYEENTSTENKNVDIIGEPVKNFSLLAEKLVNVDQDGFVKKRVIVEGGGLHLEDGCTVSIAFSGYSENENEPFDVVTLSKPLEVDLKDHGFLPGLEIAIKSMLVGELSIFLFSHKVMYGELGIPPRIKPKAQCVFYIKLIKSTITPKRGKINFSEPNIFPRVLEETKLLYASGTLLYRSNNYAQAIRIFKRAEFMLHKTRLADEKEEKVQEKFLKKIYINLAVCYNKINQPYKACTACNELARLRSLWNNGKALFQNAKALRMIGAFDSAEKRLKKAMTLHPDSKEMIAEMELLIKVKNSCNQSKLLSDEIIKSGNAIVSENFKMEVDTLIKSFKANANISKLALPEKLSTPEMDYIKSICIRENLFFNKVPKDVLEAEYDENKALMKPTFALDKEDQKLSTDKKTQDSESKTNEIDENKYE